MAISILCAIIVLLIKAWAYSLTQSQAIFADFMESLLHLGTVTLTTISLWYAAKPPDREHRYGHGKVAYFSAALEGILVLITGGGTLYNAINSYIKGSHPHDLGTGLFLVTTVVVINLFLGTYLLRIGKQKNNTVLTSHGHHVLTDMWTSLGVIVSLAATWLTNASWVDPLVGALVAVWILYTGGKVCLQAYQGLMERIDENAHTILLETLRNAINNNQIDDYHQLRHRRVNDQLWIEVHLLFDGNLPLKDAHQKATAVELDIIQRFPKDHVHVITHLEPKAHAAAHPAQHPDSKPA